MKSKGKNLLALLLVLLLLAAAALSIPSGDILPEAAEAYTESYGDDEFDFL